ncbi:MAG: Crp/Fnr family transcriptional regulator [Planctomycetes bacterium]|nr:Crp/Fnr family transcriptional regulator [Planctomycetota bacterium]
MDQALRRSELFADLDEDQSERLAEIAQPLSLKAGEYLFLLGDFADRLFIVVEGRVEACFPLNISGEIQDVAVESKLPGSTLGWSAFVKPHRFTLSARAAEPSRVISIPRQELLEILEADPELGKEFLMRLNQVIGRRLLTIQALWARELQRVLDAGLVGVHGIAQG